VECFSTEMATVESGHDAMKVDEDVTSVSFLHVCPLCGCRARAAKARCGVCTPILDRVPRHAVTCHGPTGACGITTYLSIDAMRKRKFSSRIFFFQSFMFPVL